jgi:hypothetical protein
MRAFEVLPEDFVGSSDKQDHLIKWIGAPSIGAACQFAVSNYLDPSAVNIIPAVQVPFVDFDYRVNQRGETL